MFRFTLSVLVAIGLCAGGASADDKKQDRKSGRPVRGTIQKIDRESSQGTVITVEIMARKKNKDAAASTDKQEKKYTVNSSTKVEKLSGKKDNQTNEDAKADDLRTGQNVILTTKGDKVEKVQIVLARKKNK